VYRLLSAINGLLEHANIRLAPAFDSALARVWVTPNMHKVHHSRERAETDSNYGNLLSLHDRMLGTFTPSERALGVAYGLDDGSSAGQQSFGRLVAMPWSFEPELAGGKPAVATIAS
jgi:sterol desaturase/sphingolipid hydroxylase (fatty acid hydroxylase superfamily)